MILQAGDPAHYLGSDDVVDHAHPSVRALATSIRVRRSDDVDFARAAFEHVRDEFGHSWDRQDPWVTVRASEVQREGVGLCYAKAHLLAALLRAEGIPTGLCYQRLTDDGASFVLHGLVAVHLEGGWHRQDPRGNKPGVDAQFSLGDEQLAWPVRTELGEVDYPEVFVSPDAGVVSTLRAANNVLDLCLNGLPTQL